jgi:hypothetical protein
MAAAPKNVLQPYQVFTAQAMTATVHSQPTNCQYIDNMQYQLVWTGSPVGTFSVEVSSNYQQSGQGSQITVLNPGTWEPLPLTATITASGSADDALIDLNQVPCPWVRLSYNFTSGTGSVTATVSGKGI